MNYVLRSCESYAKSYIDDIAVYSQTWEEHLEHLGKVFQWLVSAGLHVKLVKCHFGASKVHYLGDVIGQGEIEPDQQKIAGVQSYPVPVTKKNFLALWGIIVFLCPTLHLLQPLSAIKARSQNFSAAPHARTMNMIK